MPTAGDLTEPLAGTFAFEDASAFEDARDAMADLGGPHPSGKLALVPGA